MKKPKPFRLRTPVPAEEELHVAVYQALRVLLPKDAIFNSWDLANAKSAVEGASKKRRGCLAGWPDCSVWHQGRVVLLELKRPAHGRLSAAQGALHIRLAMAGFPVVVCRTVVEALDAVVAAGVPLRGRVAA